MKRGERLRTLGLWALLIVCTVGWALPQTSLEYRRARWRESDALLFLPSGEYLEVVSLGYQALLADALYLWSIQYYGHHRTKEGRAYLWRIYDVITDLDPHYQDAYFTGALIMALDMSDAELAMKLLAKGAEQNPDDWIYLVESGFYAWMNLEDHALAATHFDRALQLEGTPPVVRRLRASMGERMANKTDALALWMSIYDEAMANEDERIVAVAWQHVYDLKVGLDLESYADAIRRFRADRGRPPRILRALATQGYLRVVPLDPSGQEYAYDPVTGRVADPREAGARAGR